MKVRVLGGTYWERCLEPDWDALYGSGYRAASLLAASKIEVTLTTRVSREDETLLRTFAASQSIDLDLSVNDLPTIRFDYTCPLDEPRIWPPHDGVAPHPMRAHAEVVLAFGMLDGQPNVEAGTALWDPQSAFPRMPSTVAAQRLAIVANAGQIRALGNSMNLEEAMRQLAERDHVQVVVAKNGLMGASVLHAGVMHHVPAYVSSGAFTIGSGDVFSAVFLRTWALEGSSPECAADLASRAVATYTATRSLEQLDSEALRTRQSIPIAPRPGRVYLASPFFDLGQLLLVDIAEHALAEVGMTVASPLREIGVGPERDVAPADLELLATCDSVFAILTERDVGTVFEIGWAQKHGLPIVAYAPNLAAHQRTMLAGNGIRLFDDFATAVVAAATA